MRKKHDVSEYVGRDNVRITEGMLGGDPRIGSPEREDYRLRRNDSSSYIHSADIVPYTPFDRQGPYTTTLSVPSFDFGYRSARNDA